MIEFLLSLVGELSRPVCLALFDSLWQGAIAALGLFLLLKLIRVRYARVRYALACLALVLIPALTVTSFIDHYDFLPATTHSLTTPAIPTIEAEPVVKAATAHDFDLPPISVLARIRNSLNPWLFYVWLGGVWLITLYHLAGWRRLRASLKNAVEPFDEQWQARFSRLKNKLALRRPVRIVRSLTAAAPCVVGWLRPVVLIPVAALGGLSVEELEMIIVHELAHIKRRDILINYVQTVLETLFFFNPAVWYISRRIRIEREHCCDDTAVKITGDKMKYVKALANLEELRAGTNRLAPAATTGSLLERIRRIALPSTADRSPASALFNVFSIVLLAAALFALQGLVPDRAAAENDPVRIDRFEFKSTDLKGTWKSFDLEGEQRIKIEFRRGLSNGYTSISRNFENLDLPRGNDVVFKWERDAGTFYFEGELDEYDGRLEGGGDCYFRADDKYIDRMDGLGYDLDNENCLTLAIHDVAYEYARELHDLGYDIDLDKLVEFRIHDVTTDYIRELKDLGYDDIRPDKLVELRIHNVTPDYIRELKNNDITGLRTSELVAMKIHGVEPDYIARFHELGYDQIDADRLVEMRIHGVSPDFVSDLKEYGYDNVSTSKLVEMQVHNVDIYYIRGLYELGYKGLDPSKLVEMKIHNVTPYYIKELTGVGYSDAAPSDLVSMRIHGVDASFIKELKQIKENGISEEQYV